jgi:DNA-directed RNA polymerase subunit K/omega
MPGLVPIKPDTVPFTRQCDRPGTASGPRTATAPGTAPAPGTPTPVPATSEPESTTAPGAGTGPGTASPPVPGPRHARTAGAAPSPRTALSIRSAERRRWSADLTGPDLTGLVVHGIGGIGKSTLAAQIAARACRLQPWRVVTVVSGEIGTHSLPVHPTEADLLVLDNFDDNLSGNGTGTGRIVRDPALAALLANWAGKLLITCREPFALPAPGGERLGFRHLGPLTRSGAAELALAMPALRRLTEPERDRAWRLTAGHPRTMEYLDALLATAATDLDKVAAGLSQAETPQPTELPAEAAEAVARAASDQLLADLYDGLSAGAQTVLVRASVFRAPVGQGAVAARPHHIAEAQAAGLLTVGPGRELSVHRSTADALHRRLAEAGQRDQVAAAHRRAAGYWRSRAADSSAGLRANLEAGYHLYAAGAATRPQEPQQQQQSQQQSRPSGGRHRLQKRHLRWIGFAVSAAAVAALAAAEAAGGVAVPHQVPSGAIPARAGLASASAAAEAAEVRGRAAAWVARQVSAGAILACDPAMCAALVAQGIPAGNLIVIGPGAGDPLGSAIVVATPAVRAIFGARLASVYAPEILASFGAGPARIEVRVVAPDGSAAYSRALAADRRARQLAAGQLLRNRRVTLTRSARAELAAGLVDARLLITLATLAASEPLQIIGFSDAGPGASPDLPLRTAELRPAAGTAAGALAFARAQRPPYLAARAALAPGGVVTIEFAAPSPLGLLKPPP